MNTQVREEAAAWLIEFRTEEVDAATRARFADWLRASPAHVSAYLKVASVWEDAADRPPERVDAPAMTGKPNYSASNSSGTFNLETSLRNSDPFKGFSMSASAPISTADFKRSVPLPLMEFLVSARELDAARFWSGIRASHVRARPDPVAGFLDSPGEGKPANCAMLWARDEARANDAVALSLRSPRAARRR